MKERIEYIDQLKGLDILFMVVGHVMQMSLDTNDTPLNKFYTSFHMPIFMFLSGLFVYNKFKKWNIEEFITFIKSKFRRIMLPFITIGGIYTYLFLGDLVPLITGSFYGYWFLPSLFMCMVVDVTVSYILKKIKSNTSFIIDLMIRLFIWVILILIYYTLFKQSYFRGFLYHYLFFLLGTFFTKYDFIKNFIVNNNIVYSLAIILYIITFSVEYNFSFGFNILGFFSIIILMNLFYNKVFVLNYYFTILGKNSLEIYVFHRFFIPSLLPFNCILKNYMHFDISENFVLYLFISMLVSIPICIFSLIISKIIKESHLINYICFGQTK